MPINSIDFEEFISAFNQDRVASFLTNSSGFIVEVNQAAASFFETTIANLKDKQLRTLIAGRQQSMNHFENLRKQLLATNEKSDTKVLVRTKSEDCKRMIRTNVSGTIIARKKNNVLIMWQFVDLDAIVSSSFQPTI